MTGPFPTSKLRPGIDRVRFLLAATPLCVFAVLCWVVKPASIGGNISLSYFVPFSFALALFVVDVPRADFLRLAGRLKIEFALLLVMVLLCLLSLVNSSEPFRAFRILFPCVLPLLLFAQLAALRSISPRAVEAVPRFFLYCAIALATLPLFASMALPPLASKVFISHRYTGFFENAAQSSIVLATLIPLSIAEISISKSRRRKLVWAGIFFVILYTQLRTGSKTALFVGLVAGWSFYLVIHFRKYSPMKRVAMTFGMLFLAAFIAVFGIRIAGIIDPILASKLEMIFSGGVGNYYSIQSRQELWDAAIDNGTRHWLVGSGAGETLLGIAHAHNLVLDYFRGLGIFGAISVFLLCAAILFRGFRKGVAILTSTPGPGDTRIFACYVAAAIYVVCNQLSDCFGPSTIGALWLIYLPAVFSEHCANQLAYPVATRGKSHRPRARRPLPHFAVPQFHPRVPPSKS